MADIGKGQLPSKLLWVDLEMTGLDPVTDVILEVAAMVTDFQLNHIGQYRAVVQQPLDIVQQRMDMNPWYQEFPENRQQFLAEMPYGRPAYDVERELITLIDQHFAGEPAVLAGNSIHNDRNFIKRWWPNVDAKLHYRMLDVSSWKVWMQGAYGEEYQKKNVHRAYDDIQESMAELKYYLDWFNQHQTGSSGDQSEI